MVEETKRKNIDSLIGRPKKWQESFSSFKSSQRKNCFKIFKTVFGRTKLSKDKDRENKKIKISFSILQSRVFLVSAILILLMLGNFGGKKLTGFAKNKSTDFSQTVADKDGTRKLPRIEIDKEDIFKDSRKDFQVAEDPQFVIDIPADEASLSPSPIETLGEKLLENLNPEGSDSGISSGGADVSQDASSGENAETQNSAPADSSDFATETSDDPGTCGMTNPDTSGQEEPGNENEAEEPKEINSFRGVLDSEGQEAESGTSNSPEGAPLSFFLTRFKKNFGIFQETEKKFAQLPDFFQNCRNMASGNQKKISEVFWNKLRNWIGPKEAGAAGERIVKTEVLNAAGEPQKEITTLVEEKDGKAEITVVKPERSFKPGKYQLKVEMLSSDGTQVLTTVQDFSWGVLAINVNKSIYSPDETAKIAMAVLNEDGNMVCDANLRLEILNPKSEILKLSTEDGTIKVNSETCQSKEFTLEPDFEAEYQTGEWGTYEMTLTAETYNGKYTISDSFEVSNLVAFDVERTSATRIFPGNKYPVNFNIVANQDFNGEIREAVPDSFEILNPKSEALNKFEIQNSNSQNEKYLVWDVNVKKGDKLELSYEYDAPGESPQFYLLGPLRFIEKNKVALNDTGIAPQTLFEEARQWQVAVDQVTANGFIFYGDTTNVGKLKVTPFTNPSSYLTEINTNIGSAVNIMHVAGRTAPTREEIMFGYVSANPTTQGRLDIITCKDGCDVAGDYYARWNHNYVSAAQDCDSGPTIGTCYQPFDLGYEALSGRALVVYAGDGADAGTVADTDTVYYALWNGSAWSPNTTPGTPGVTNAIDMPGTGGTPEWIRVIPAGDNLANNRSNRAMVLVSDSDDDLYAFYWDGSAFDSGTELFTTLGNCGNGRCFDGNWQGNNNFVVSYTNSGQNHTRYQKYTVGSGWIVGDTLQYATAATPAFIQSVADPTSSRILSGNNTTANDTRSAVWRGDDTNDGWDVCASGGCPDTVTEGAGGPQMSVAFERFNGEGLHVFNDAATNAAQGNKYMTYTPTATWGSATLTGITPSDDHQSTRAVASPNSDDIMIIAADVDCDVDAIMWNGNGFGTVGSNFELLLSSSNNSCANSVPIPGMATSGGYDFAWTLYSSWGHNWRWTDDEANPTPASWLANENDAPSTVQPDGDTVRLRYSFVNRGVIPQALTAEGRKKLQWTTDSPDSLTATWTDVAADDGAGTWRYNNCAAGTDDAAIPSAQLTAPSGGSNQVGDFMEGSGNITMTHNAGPAVAVENDYCIESNGATSTTTYYFRAYDNEQQTPVFREQTNFPSTPCGGGSSTCSYPYLTIAAAAVSIGGTSNIGVGTTVAVAVNNSLQGQTATVQGDTSWSISSVAKPSNGDIITVFASGADPANESTGITRYSGSGSVSGMVLDANVLSIGDAGTRSVTVADLCNATYNWDNGDNEDVMHTCSGTTITVDGGSSYDYEKIDILSGDTLTFSGTETLATYDLTITGTLSSTGASTYNIAHNWTNNGSFTQSSSTVNMNGTTAQAIGGSASTPAFNSINISNASAEVSASANFSVGGTLTVGASAVLNPGAAVVISGAGTLTGSGTAKVSRASGNDLASQYTLTRTLTNLTVDYTGNTGSGLTITDTTYGSATGNGGLKISGSITTGTQTATVAGIFTVSGTFTPSGGTITMNNASWTSNPIGTLTFQNITIADSANVTGNNSFSVAGNFTIGASATFNPVSTVVISGNGTLTGSGTARVTRTNSTPDFSSQYTISNKTLTNLTVAYVSDSAQTISAVNYGNLLSSGAGGRTLASTGTIGISGTFTVGGNTYTTTGSTVDYNGAGQTVGAINYNNLTLSGSGTKTLQAGTTTIGGNLQISGTAAATTVVGLAVNGTLTVSGGSLTTAGFALTVTGTTTVNGGTLTLDNNTGTKLLTGAVAVSSGILNGASTAIEIRNGITQSSSGSVAITGTATFTTTASQALGGTISLAATTIGTGVTLTNNGTTSISGTLTLTGNWVQANGSTLNYSSTSSMAGAGTFSASTATNTVNYSASGAQTVKDPNGGTAHTYSNLTLSGTSAKDMTGVTAITGDLTVSGSASWNATNAAFTLTGTLNYSSSGSTTLAGSTDISIGKLNQSNGTIIDSGVTITVSGTGAGVWTKSGGTFTPTGTVIFTGVAPEIGDATTFNNLTINVGGGNTATLTGSLDVNGDFSLQSGGLNCSGQNQNIAGDFSLSNGTVWTSGGTLTFDGDTAKLLTDSNGTKQNLGTVVIGDGSTAKVINLGFAAKATNLTVTNNATFSHNGANNLNLSGNLALNTGAQGSQYTKGGTLTFDGTGTNTINDANGTKRDLGAVVIDTSGTKTINLNSSVTVTSMQVKTNTTLDLGSSSYVLTITGTGQTTSRPLYVNGGTLTAGGICTIRYTGAGTVDTESGTFYNLELLPSSGTPTYNLGNASSQTITMNNDLVIGNAANVAAHGDTYNPTINMGGSISIGANSTYTKSSNGMGFYGSGTATVTDNTSAKQDLGNVTVGNGTVAKTLNLNGTAARMTNLYVANNATFSHNGANNLNLGGNLTLDATSIYTKGGALTFDGSGTNSIIDNNDPKQDLGTVVIGDGSTAKVINLGFAAKATNLTVTNNATFSHNGANNLNLSGNLALNTGAQGSQYTKGGTLTFDGTSQTITDSNGTLQDLGAVTIGPSTTTSVSTLSAVKVTSLTIGADDTLDITDDTLTITGSGTAGSRPFIHTTGTFTVASSTVKFTGTGDTTIQETTYNNLELSPSGGSTPSYILATTGSQTITAQNLTIGNGTNGVSVTATTNNPVLDINGDVLINNAGSFAGGTQSITVGTDGTTDGDFTIESGGAWTAGSGTLILDGGSAGSPVVFDDKNGTKQNMGTVQIGASPAVTNLNSNFAAASLTVSAGDAFNTRGYDVDIATFILVYGTLNCIDDKAGDGTDITLGTNWTVDPAGIFTADEDSVKYTTVTFDHTGTASLSPGGTGENFDFYDISFAKSSAATTTLQADIHVENDLNIGANSTLDTGSDRAITIGGSWANSGTFTPNSSLVTFDSSAGSETIDAGGTGAGKAFHDVTFNDSGGDWTIQNSDMKAVDLTITDASSLTLAAGLTLEVTGTYTIEPAETSATTWNSGSVLYLNGTSQTIGSKTQSAEDYDKLQIGDNTDIRMWNSRAVNGTTPYTVSASGSLYSMDHASVGGAQDGDLYIWGDYHTTSHDYWDYNYDFDSADISGTPRDCVVKLASGAVVTVDAGETLEAIGISGHLTAVDWQSSGGYNIVNYTGSPGGTINFQYASFDHLKGNKGIDVQTGSVVTSLDYCQFDNLVNVGSDDAFIYVQSSVIIAAPKTFTDCQFANTGSGAEFNVNRTGTDDNSKTWNFTGTTGAFGVEANDAKDGVGVDEGDPGMLVWPDSISEVFSLSCAAAAAMPDYNLGDTNNYNNKDFTADEKCTVTDTGHDAEWTLTLQSTNLTGAQNNLANTNIKLTTDGTPESAPTLVSSTTGITEPASDNYSLDQIRTVIQGAAVTASGTYDVQITSRLESLNTLYSETGDEATMTFTLQ